MNWKTTAAGVSAVLLGVSHLIIHLLTGDTTMNVVYADLAGIVTGAGLIAAKDASAH